MNEWLETRFGHPAYDPSLWRVAKANGEVIGAIFVFDVRNTGYASTVALRSDARGQGVGPALLRSAFAALRDRGQMRVLVSLDADAAAGIVTGTNPWACGSTNATTSSPRPSGERRPEPDPAADRGGWGRSIPM